jgi:hypothetical protein
MFLNPEFPPKHLLSNKHPKVIVCAYCGRETINRDKPCEGCAAHKYITKESD